MNTVWNASNPNKPYWPIQARDSQPHTFHTENPLIFMGPSKRFHTHSNPRPARLVQNTRQTETPLTRRGYVNRDLRRETGLHLRRNRQLRLNLLPELVNGGKPASFMPRKD